MASTRRRSSASLKARIFEQPQDFDFFQIVRLLEAIAAEENRQAGEPPPDPVGSGVDPRNGALSLRSSVPLGFAAAEVTAVRRPRRGGPAEVTQTLLGLTGPSGVLPHAVSEMVQISVRERNPALRDFFDVFNNRLAGLLYDAWAKYRIVVETERAERLGKRRTIDIALKSLVGFGLSSIANRMQTPDDTLVFYGGHLSRRGRSVVAVQRALSGAIGHPVRIKQFLGQWLPIAPADRTRLPDRACQEGTFARLGQDAVIGKYTFDIQSSVLLCVGPLRHLEFRSLLPDGARARLLTDMAAVALGPDKSFRIRLELHPDQVPELRLDADENRPEANRLGWNTWLASSTRRSVPAVAEFRPAPHLR